MINKFPVGPVYASRPTTATSSTSASRGKNGGRPVRYLDLSFEGRQHSASASLSSGFRSQCRGTRNHPPSPYSFNKSAEYQQSLQGDLEELLAEEGQTPSPSWAIQASREPNHSGESPLFVNKLIATRSRLDREGLAYPKVLIKNGRMHNPPPSATSSHGYRPNSTHQFLAHTELRDASQSEVNTRLGKPTRTTLLRARQRCNSAPVNSYETRREIHKRAEEKLDMHRSWNSNVTVKDVLAIPVPDGESLHSFLTGARYNRTHYLDSKSLSEHGVYMPRGNPLGCFIMKSKCVRGEPVQEDTLQQPDSPTSELESVLSEESLPEANYPHPSPLCSPPTSPEPQLYQQAVERDPDLEPDTEATIEPPATYQSQNYRPVSTHSRSPEILLNVKGVGLNRPRPHSAHSLDTEPCKVRVARPQTARVLRTVLVQGRAISPSPRHKETLEITASTPSLNINNATTGDKDLPIKVDLKSAVSLKTEEPIPKVVKVDKSVNVPSVSGDSRQCDEGREKSEEDFLKTSPREKLDMDDAENENNDTEETTNAHEQVKSQQDSPSQVMVGKIDETSNPVYPENDTGNKGLSVSKNKKGKVRFADEVVEEKCEQNKYGEDALAQTEDEFMEQTTDVKKNLQQLPVVKDSGLHVFLTEDKDENICGTAGFVKEPQLSVDSVTTSSGNQHRDTTNVPISNKDQNSGDFITVDISVKTPD